MTRKRSCIGKMPHGLDAYISRARVIQGKLSAPQFNALTTTPAMVIANLDQLEVYQAEKLDRNYANLPARDSLWREVKSMISAQVAQVNVIANGDEATLALSGFDLNKEPAPIPMPAKGKVENVEDMNSGTAMVTAQHIPFVRVYEVEVTSASGFVKRQVSMYSKIKVSDLPVSVKLSIKVRGINNKGEGIWSAPYGFVAKMNSDLDHNSNND